MRIFGTDTNPDTMRWKLIKDRLTRLLRQGTSPRQLAWSLTLGLWIGVFPVIGTCNLIITFIALRYKLNLALMIALSYLVYPIQIALFVPFAWLGERLFGVVHSGLTWEVVKASFQQNIWETLKEFSEILLYASAGWLVVSLPVVTILYWITLLLFKARQRRKGFVIP